MGAGRVRVVALGVVLAVAANAPAGAATTPRLTKQQATTVARKALQQYAPRAVAVRITCSARGSYRAGCAVAWRQGARRYQGTVTIARSATATRVDDRYTLAATGVAQHKRKVRLRRSGVVSTRPPAPPTPHAPKPPAPTPPAPGPSEPERPALKPGDSPSNPIPLGEAGSLNGWQLRVVGMTTDATADVLAFADYNKPPIDGFQYAMATVEVTRTAQTPGRFYADSLAVFGASGVGYQPWYHSCGEIPGGMPYTDVFPGGALGGTICWQVRSEDASTLVLYTDATVLGGPAKWIYFALH